MEGKIFRFDDRLVNMFLKTRFPGKMNGKHTIIRLVEGDDELDEKKQAEKAQQRQFRVTSKEMFITDEVLINFLEHNPDFGTLITIHDPEAENKAKMAELNKGLTVLMNVSKMKDQELLQLGILKFGSKQAMEEVKGGDYNGLRLQLAAAAQQNPEEIENLLDKKENANNIFSALAFAAGIVKEDESGSSVKWADNDAKIVSVTKGMRPAEELANYFQTEEGNMVKHEIGVRMELKASKKAEDAGSNGDDSDEANKAKTETKTATKAPAKTAEVKDGADKAEDNK